MSWVLFCQIEVILLTVGLVTSFVVNFHHTAKDNSWFKRISALGKAFEAYGKSVSNENAKVQVLNELVDAIKKDKEKKE